MKSDQLMDGGHEEELVKCIWLFKIRCRHLQVEKRKFSMTQ